MTDYFDEANRLGRDQAEGWFSFGKVGDKVGGKIIDMFYSPARGVYKEQRCFTLKQDDGKVVNVGLKYTEYNLVRTDNLQAGDDLGVVFEREIAPKVTGLSPTKSIAVFPKEIGPRIKGKQAKDLAAPSSSLPATANEEDKDEVDKVFPPQYTNAPETAALVTPAVPVATTSSSMDAVRNLAAAQGLTTREMTVLEQNELIREYTMLEVTEENVPNIIIKLSGYVK